MAIFPGFSRPAVGISEKFIVEEQIIDQDNNKLI